MCVFGPRLPIPWGPSAAGPRHFAHAEAAGLDQRPLTRREVVRHCEAFGIDEEMCCNRQIRGFSAGQKAPHLARRLGRVCVPPPASGRSVPGVLSLRAEGFA